MLPVGSLAQDLALKGEGISGYVEPSSGWTIVGPQPDVLLAVPTAETAVFPAAGETTGEPSKVRFSVEPRGGASEVTVDGLYITLKNIAVSNKTGVARIGIEEWATTGSTIPTTPNSGVLEVAKFPFRSGADPSPGVGRALVAVTGVGGPPATRIGAGAPVRLEWHHARGDNHELYMDGERVTDSSIAGGSAYPVAAGRMARDTAFALKTVTPTPDGGYVTRWDHLTVCVTDQTLASLTVSGPLTAQGAVKAEQALEVTGAVTAKSTLGVTGNTTVSGTLGVAGKLTADGDVQVNQAFKTGSAGESVFYHNVTVYTPNKLIAGQDLQVNGTVTGGLSVAGTLSAARLSASQDITRNGKGAICHNDTIGLKNTRYPGWLYAANDYFDYDGDRARVFRWKPGNRVNSDEWQVSRDSTGTTLDAPENADSGGAAQADDAPRADPDSTPN
ncbi:hypothetical protein SSP35_21_00780 [Streptomyces sp. NBRC 110611]|nr:hypothetical protein SSP35_21_00780 [Streptomyces sp. NBRC 110611]